MNDVQNPLFTAKMIWAFMTFSFCVYVGLAYALAQGFIPFEFPDAEDADVFLMVLSTLSCTSLILAYVLPGRLKVPPLTAHILRWALLESLGIFGLIYFFCTGDFDRSLFLFGAGLVGLFLAFPKQSQSQ